MKFSEIKLTAVSILAIINSTLGVLAVPIYMLALLNLVDYFTGLVSAPYREEQISSYKSFSGIVKKISMWVLVIIGGVVDWLLIFATENAGIDIKISYYMASLVAIWLIANEIISVLENLADIGVPMPSFLMTLVKKIQDMTNIDV